MKYLKTFEYLMNDKIYRIEVYDKNNPTKIITTSTVTGTNDKYSVITNFKASNDYLRIKKDNPNSELEIRISDLQDSFADMLDKKKNKSLENYNTTSLYRIVVYDLKKRNSPPQYGVIVSMKTRSELDETGVKDDFLKSNGYKNIEKSNPNADLYVKVERDYNPVKDDVKINDIKL